MTNKNSSTSTADYTPMKGSKELQFQLKDIVDIVMMLHEHDNLGEFTRFAKKNNLIVTVGSTTVNHVKEFVARREGLRSNKIGKKILNPKKTPQIEVLASLTQVKKRDPYKHCCGF